jgi:hypothetical protein
MHHNVGLMVMEFGCYTDAKAGFCSMSNWGIVIKDGLRIPGNGLKIRQDEWTDSLAVGSRTFIERVKGLLGARAMGREIKEGGGVSTPGRSYFL